MCVSASSLDVSPSETWGVCELVRARVQLCRKWAPDHPTWGEGDHTVPLMPHHSSLSFPTWIVEATEVPWLPVPACGDSNRKYLRVAGLPGRDLLRNNCYCLLLQEQACEPVPTHRGPTATRV